MIETPMKSLFKLLLFLFCSFHSIHYAYSQDTHSILLEPEFNVVLQSENQWSYSFGMAHRGIILEIYEKEKVPTYYTEHLELNHYTQYSFSSRFEVALRIRYRLREIFEDIKHDEIRFIEEFEYTHTGWPFQPKHRVRIEQNIENLVSYRARYQFSASQPISREFLLILGTEALYGIAKNQKPEPEQRFEVGITNTSFGDLELSLGLEYRLDNYIRDPQREYFVLTGATLHL